MMNMSELQAVLSFKPPRLEELEEVLTKLG